VCGDFHKSLLRIYVHSIHPILNISFQFSEKIIDALKYLHILLFCHNEFMVCNELKAENIKLKPEKFRNG